MVITAERSIQRKVISNTAGEIKEITWDGEEFELLLYIKADYPIGRAISYTPEEYKKIQSFGDEI